MEPCLALSKRTLLFFGFGRCQRIRFGKCKRILIKRSLCLQSAFRLCTLTASCSHRCIAFLCQSGFCFRIRFYLNACNGLFCFLRGLLVQQITCPNLTVIILIGNAGHRCRRGRLRQIITDRRLGFRNICRFRQCHIAFFLHMQHRQVRRRKSGNGHVI